MHNAAVQLQLAYSRHAALIDRLCVAAQRAYVVVKVAMASWAAFLAARLGTSPECAVAPHCGDVVALRCLLVTLAAAELAQIMAPPWLLLDLSAERLPRKAAGTMAAVLPPFLILAMALAALTAPSYDGAPREGCADAVAVGPFGMFELCAIVANLEGSAMIACVVIGALCGCIGFSTGFLCLPIIMPAGFLATRIVGMKREAALSRIEVVPYTAEGMPSTCSICLDDFERGDACNRLPCNVGHVFHVECLQCWLSGSKNCPLCRVDVLEALAEARRQRPAAAGLPRREPRSEATGWSRNDIIYTL